MNIRLLNYILILIVVLLVINLAFPLKAIAGDVISRGSGELGCEINGNEVKDLYLCCHEMTRFDICKDGICESGNYRITTNEDTMNYCRLNGYDVRF